MKEVILQCLAALGTGTLVGIIFALVKLPVPAPNALAGVAGILGITLGYMIFTKVFA